MVVRDRAYLFLENDLTGNSKSIFIVFVDPTISYFKTLPKSDLDIYLTPDFWVTNNCSEVLHVPLVCIIFKQGQCAMNCPGNGVQ